MLYARGVMAITIMTVNAHMVAHAGLYRQAVPFTSQP